MWRFILIAFLPGLAFAGSVEDDTSGCMFKTEASEMRSCLSDVYYRRGTEMDDRIASVAYGTGLTGLQADVIASKFESAQTEWRVKTDQRCQKRGLVARELCRLSSLQVREAELSAALDKVMRANGG